MDTNTDPFHGTGLFRFSLNTSESYKFFLMFSGGYRKRLKEVNFWIFLQSKQKQNFAYDKPHKVRRILKSWTSSERLMYVQFTSCVQGGIERQPIFF